VACELVNAQAESDVTGKTKVGRLLAIPPARRLTASKLCFKETRNTGGGSLSNARHGPDDPD
ncbi:hypothetical protein, partial [Pseudomonas simiae]|uniref:hypothetical protein n=1 Tax=Pseudomonas simiae TaxID=321846 RepID=UPI001CA3951E